MGTTKYQSHSTAAIVDPTSSTTDPNVLKVNADGSINVVDAGGGGAPVVVTGSGVAGTAAPGVVTVQGIAGATAIPVSGPATDANLDEKFGDLGQAVMAASAPVTLASDQSPLTVVGRAANGVAALGNPNLVAGLGNSAGPASATAGSAVSFWVNPTGSLTIAAGDYGGGTGADAVNSMYGFSGRVSVGLTPVPVAIGNYLFNNASMDRQRGNIDTAALITLAAAGASTVNSADQTNYNGRGVQVGVNLGTVTTATVTVNIQGKDVASGQYYNILSSTALAAAGFVNLTVYPGAAATANLSTPQPLPRIWRAQAVIAGVAAAVTGTVGASVIV